MRELRNFIERSVSLGLVEAQPPRPSRPPPAGGLPSLDSMVALRLPLKEARQAWIESFESVYLREVLSKSGGNVTRAAERAKVSRRFLQRMIARLGIRPADVGGTDSSKILSPLTLRLSGQDPIAPTETPAAVLASSDEEECTMRKAVLVGLLGFVAGAAALTAARGLPEAHAQATPKSLAMRLDPDSASGKFGPITSVIVSNAGGDFQVIVKSANGNCIIHMASLADALSLKAQINGAQTTMLSCLDSTGAYKLPSPPTSTQYFTLTASP